MLSRQRRFLFALVLLSHLCRGCTATTTETIIKEGEPYTFRCTGQKEMSFTYPSNRSVGYDTFFTYTSPFEIWKNRYENGTYVYYFYRPSTIFGDTGWYGCSYDPILGTEHHLSDHSSVWYYLYVEPETVRFVEQSHSHTLVANVDEDLVIPCRPTSPTAEVQLIKHDDHGYLEAGRHYTFDPKLGFTLHEVNKLHGGLYTCTIAPDQELSYNVVVAQENRLPEPRIINNSSFMHVIKGETLNLKCDTWIPSGVDYEVFWIPMHKSERVSTWSDRMPQFNGPDRKIVSLTVRAANFNDEGIYECRVKKGIYQTNSRTYVMVYNHEWFSPYVNLTSRNSSSYKLRESSEVEWVVDVQAFPPPELRWFHTNFDKITSLLPPGESRFLIDSTCCQPKLRINRLNLNDMGMYSIEASNQYKNVTLNFMLDVIASPKVDIRGLVSHNFPTQVANIECHVKAFPKPNITWIYSKCSNYPTCDDGTFEYLKSTKESGTVTSLLSTISATPDMSGRLTCNACNFLGCRNVTVHMNYFGRTNFGVQVTTDTVFEGDDWELICYASAEHYLDIYWSSENGRIVLSDRISISRGSTQFTYTSVLRIHNVSTKDSREYMCTGRSRNDWRLSTVYHLEVKAGRAPSIIDTNLNNNEIIIDVTTLDQKGLAFHCIADGIPKPSMSWFKDGVQLAVTNKEYKFLNDSQTLELEYLLEIDSGEYICRAENRLGKVEVSQRLLIKVEGVVDNRLIGLIVLIVVLAMIVVILVIYFFKMVHSERTIREQLMEALPVRFRRTTDERFHQNLYVDDPTGFGRRL